MKYRGLLFFCFLSLPVLTRAQVCGLEDTLWIAPNATHTFTIDVAGLVNNDLAHPAQGICGVELEFVHQLSQNLEIWLSAPDGSAVQLIGPNTDLQTAFTFLARWDISFVPCSQTPSPDPGYNPQWHNLQPNDFVSGGRYLGNYWPYEGCLENFDSGPVNGTWTLTVVNDPSPFYGGAILDFRLVFCDPRGPDCCFADAGIFSRLPILSVCEGADTLSRLPLRPFWPGRAPDSMAFGYGYILSTDTLITAFTDTIPNAQLLPPGQYQVCGFSYAREDLPLIPTPDGSLRLDSLRSNLNSFFPDFCADISPACAQILILPNPDTTFLQATRCFGQAFSVGDSTYRSSGTFITTLSAQGGCDSIVVLQLNILPEWSTVLDRTVCEGESVMVGNSLYSVSGTYSDTLSAANGCDSVVTLHLLVLPPQTTLLSTTICAGDAVQIGNQQFNTPGTYTVRLSSSQGCDSTVVLNLAVFNPTLAIATPDTITCFQPLITLQALSSNPTDSLRFSWSDAAGTILGTTPTVAIAQSGLYRLAVRPADPQLLCLITDSIFVFQNNAPPVALAGPDKTITCAIAEVSIGDLATNTAPPFVAEWRNSSGQLLLPAGQAVRTTAIPDTYFLSVFNAANGCTAMDTVVVLLDTLPPPISASPDARITCAQPLISIGQPNSLSGIVWSWSGPCILGSSSAPVASVQCTGTFIVQALSVNNGCTASDTIQVTMDTLAPILTLAPAPVINCLSPVVTLQAIASAGPQPLSYAWSGPGILSGANTALPIVNGAGTYRVVVRNTANGCEAADEVLVTTDTIHPNADAGPVGRLTCVADQVMLGSPNTSTGASMQYSWQSTGGQISGPANTPIIIATAIGSYALLVTDATNGCVDSSTTIVILDQQAPFVDAGASAVLDCEIREVFLDGSASASGGAITYQWSGPCLTGSTNGLTAFAECPGQYQLMLTNTSNGCSASDSVSVFLSQATALAVLPDTVYVNCATGIATIDGSQSVYGVFDWQYNGAPVNIVDISPGVTMPGWYLLNVNTLALNCPDSDSTLVLLDCPVVAEIVGDGVLTCEQNNIILHAGASSDGPGFTYQWSGPAASCVATGQGSRLVQVVCPGQYQLIVTNTIVGTADTAYIQLGADLQIPTADAITPDTITCIVLSALLDGSGSSSGPRFEYRWTDLNGTFLGNAMQLNVSAPGNYFLEVTDTINGCSAVDVVSVIQLSDPVNVNFGNAVFPCGQDSFLLRAFPNPLLSNYVYSWSGSGIRSDPSMSEIWIDTLGRFSLTVLSPLTGCSVTDSILVTQPVCGPCIRVASPDTITCALTSVQLLASFCEPCPGCSVAWSALSGTILAGQQTLSPVVTAGTFMLLVTDTAGITSELSVLVPSNTDPPTVDAGPNRNLSCRDTLIQLGTLNTSRGPSFAHSWQALSGLPPDAAANPEAFTRFPGSYVLLTTNLLTGCVASDTVLIGLDTLHPVADAGPDLLITCSSPFVSPSGEASTLGNNIAYLWRASPPAWINGGETTLNPIVGATGIYTLTVTNTLNGCSATDTMQVGLSNEVPPLPGIPDQTLSCRDTLIALNISPVDTTFTYAWFRTGSIDTIMGTGISISVPGNYRLRVTNTGNACTNTGFFTVFLDTVPPMVDAGIPPGVLNCSNPSLMLSGMAGPKGIGSLSMQWSALAGSPISDPGTLNPGISFPDTYVLRVTRPDNGCSAADSVTILFNDDYPIVMAGPDTVLTCAMPVIQLQGSVQTAGAAVQWRWTSSTGNIIGGASTATATINRPGPYHLEVTDLASGCMGIDSVNVTMDTIAPLIELIAPLGLSLSCAVDSVVLDVGTTQSTGAAIFSWRPLSGNGDQLLGSRVVLGTVGVYQVIAVQTANGCSDTLNVQVSGNYERPELNLTVSGLLNCITDTVQLQANTAVIPGADGALWRLPSGDSLLGTALSLPVSEPGTYRLRLINPENGCATESGVSVGADFIPPVAQILSPDTINCLRPQVTLSSAGSYGRGMLRYQWVGPAGGGLIFPDTLSVATTMRSGLYTLMLTDEINGCKDTAFAEVIALANPITALEASLVSPSCYGEADGAINILQIFGGSPPYQYRFNQGSFSARTDYDQLTPGQYPIRILDASGCSLDTTLYLPETPLLVVELGEDTILSLGESIRLVAQPNRPVQQYRWWPAGGGIVQDAADQLLTPLFEETYRVIVTDDRGCTATDWVNVQINKEKLFFMPGAFSPNGDGINDYVEVFTGKGIASVRSLSVYDRWGNLLFNRKDYLPGEPVLGWDGYFRGMPMKPGVYVVHAVLQRIDGQQEVYSGELLLLR